MSVILVTGGAGYIGSHCVLSLLEKSHQVIVFDNLSTGHRHTVDSLAQIGKDRFSFVQGDLLNIDELEKAFATKVDAVIHFAAFSQVGESVDNPSKYYRNNVVGSLNLLDMMVKHSVDKIVFSSSAAVYGEPDRVPIEETSPTNPINPYGQTKLCMEKIMHDYDKAYGIKSIRLRYFNVIGADSKLRIGEWHESETHLLPNILKSTLNNSRVFEIFGDDYDTKDGTCVRDYINIEDLIDAHVLAFEALQKGSGSNVFNLGTSEGNSVKEVFDMCQKVSQQTICVRVVGRRPGDPARLIADNKKAQNILGWHPSRTLEQSVKTGYEWEKKLAGILKQ